MTRQEFKAFREYLCLSQQDLADEWSMGAHGARTIRRWETGERPLNPIAAYCIKLMPDKKPQSRQMARHEFRAAREYLCLSQQELADEWGMGSNGGRTIRRWEAGERPLNPVAAYCIALMADNLPQYVDGNGKTVYL